LQRYKPGYRSHACLSADRLPVGEESPDSTEQCTGEEPGSATAGTDSATENNLTPKPLSTRWRGRARSERVKM